LLDGQAQALTQKAIDLALTGDMAALRLCFAAVAKELPDRYCHRNFLTTLELAL
jgi:hypothetical protein